MTLQKFIASLKADQQAVRALTGLIREASAKQIVTLLGLMVAAALTEGIGIMLLVPLIGVAADFGALASPFDRLFGWVGVTPDMGLLLCLFVAVIALRALLQYLLKQARDTFEFTVVDQLRSDCFGGLMHAEWRWITQKRASDFSAVLITNIGRVGSGFTAAVELIATMLVAIAYLSTALLLSWQTALVVALFGALATTAFSSLRRRVTELGSSFGRANRTMHQQVQEGVAAIRMTKLTGNEQQQVTAFESVVDSVRSKQIAYARLSAFGQAALQVGGATLLALMVYAGLKLWQVPIPVLLPLMLVAVRLIPILGMLQQGWQRWLHAVPALDEVRALLADLHSNAEPDDAGIAAPALRNEIVLDAVSLTYAGRKSAALNAVSLSIKANQTTAIIGVSGSGKSSLADIITGLIEPDHGSFIVDGVPIAGAMRRRWRQAVSYVQQDTFLFHASIRDNLLWAHPGASELTIADALNKAAAGFVFALPEGLDTVVGDSGVRLSGGERQRIALARALLRSPELLVLDEATSALDPANETAIREAISNIHGNMTIILIGHRLAFLDQADRVIELSDGKILHNGSRQHIQKSIKALEQNG